MLMHYVQQRDSLMSPGAQKIAFEMRGGGCERIV